MVCIYCSGPTHVINSRHQTKLNRVWRRRKCLQCGAMYSTIESVDEQRSLMFSTDPNQPTALVPFSRDRLFISIYESCRHRKSPVDEAAALTDTILTQALKKVQLGTINKLAVKTIAYNVLKRFDNAAAVHYKAYYWD